MEGHGNAKPIFLPDISSRSFPRPMELTELGTLRHRRLEDCAFQHFCCSHICLILTSSLRKYCSYALISFPIITGRCRSRFAMHKAKTGSRMLRLSMTGAVLHAGRLATSIVPADSGAPETYELMPTHLTVHKADPSALNFHILNIFPVLVSYLPLKADTAVVQQRHGLHSITRPFCSYSTLP